METVKLAHAGWTSHSDTLTTYNQDMHHAATLNKAKAISQSTSCSVPVSDALPSSSLIIMEIGSAFFRITTDEVIKHSSKEVNDKIN